MGAQEELLRPTLDERDRAAKAIYSARTGWVASVLGGPLAGATIALLNAHRLKRLRTDWPLGVLALIAAVGPLWWHFHGAAKGSSDHGGDAAGLLSRLLGVGFFALVYQLHRPYYRSMGLMGVTSPPGWVVGAAAIAGGIAVTIGLVALLSP